jgi:hypothetical protein
MTRAATCSCGSLRIVCEGEPENVSLCHCLACQRLTGSTYGIAAFFRDQDVIAYGRASSYTRKADSGFRVTFHFCPIAVRPCSGNRSACPI